MERLEFILDGRRCLVWSHDAPEALLVEPIDERDLDFIGRELDYLGEHADRPFALAALFCREHCLPFYCFKAVSDNLDGSLKDWRGILGDIRKKYVEMLKAL